MKKMIVVILAVCLCLGLCACESLGTEEIGPLYIIGLIIGLVLNIFLCGTFANFAQEKGYSFGKYFLLCFLLGIIGFVWVAALPDGVTRYEVRRLQHEVDKLLSQTTVSEDSQSTKETTMRTNSSTLTIGTNDVSVTEDGKWTCGKCNTTNSMNYGQCKKCGHFRGQ